MKTLFVAWKKKDPGGWFPVGRLDADVRENVYSFRYVRGAELAAAQAGFAPFDSFPNLRQEYVSGSLFPFFLNRMQNPNRPSFQEYLKRLDLSPNSDDVPDPIDVLAVSEGQRATDNLEVFPKIQRIEGKPFEVKFFLHGLRYLAPSSQEEIGKLQVGQDLAIALEANNPATGWAIQFQTRARIVIGYAPRYLVNDLAEVIGNCGALVSATLVRVNPPPAPPGQRLMVTFEGCWPEGYEPMNTEEFQPLVPSHTFLNDELAAAS
jgi:hypothetical protein